MTRNEAEQQIAEELGFRWNGDIGVVEDWDSKGDLWTPDRETIATELWNALVSERMKQD
jgi:hypothetical protein